MGCARTSRTAEVEDEERMGYFAFILIALIMLTQWSCVFAQEIEADRLIHFNIPRQQADIALTQFAEQADMTFIFPFEKAKEKIANRLVGSYSRQEAIEILLVGTGLKAVFSSNDIENGADSQLFIKLDDPLLSKREKSIWLGFKGFLVTAFGVTDGRAQGQTEGSPENVIEEIFVTARKQAEPLQDVPVTVTVLSEMDLDRYNATNLDDAAKMVPNLQINHGSSGSGADIYLRGVGSSSSSAAFDQSVAINIDGVIVNHGRFIHNSYLDMGQFEVLKGPQSLYFGKSATAGVISISTNDPSDEFEFEIMAGMETEHDRFYNEMIISGPLTDTFGARLVVGSSETDELWYNLYPGVANKWRGEKSLNARLTLLWEPTDNLQAKLKWSYSAYENDGPLGRAEEFCPDGAVQATQILGGAKIFPGVDDCRQNGNTSISDIIPALAIGFPYGADDGVPFLDQETQLLSLQVDWDINDSFNLVSVSAYIDLDHVDAEVYSHDAGVFSAVHHNSYEALSQEFRLSSNYEGAFNFMAGFFYQNADYVLDAYQTPVNFGLLTPDPVTGNGYDYDKHHYTDTEVLSVFLAGYWDVTDSVEISSGLRYTHEKKSGYITIPYVHTFAQGLFSAPPLIDGLEFEDDNLSPEIAVTWSVNDEINLFASYREGFKSGGIDNSALPSASLNNNNPDLHEFLVFKSETAEGFEVGMKARLLGDSMLLNATVFSYDYGDLQVQLSDNDTIQYITFNASGLSTDGVEFDLFWMPEVEGLTVRTAWAYTDAKYTDTFLNPDGQDLDGEDRERNAKFSGFAGISYDFAVGDNWRIDTSFDARYNSGYGLDAWLDSYQQDSFWLADASIRLYLVNSRWEFSFIALNMRDKIVAYSSGSRPGACVETNLDAVPPDVVCAQMAKPVLQTELDQLVTTGEGRKYMIGARYRF